VFAKTLFFISSKKVMDCAIFYKDVFRPCLSDKSPLQLQLINKNSWRGENRMNENRIQQVLEIEQKAQEIHEVALRDAQQLQVSADKESQATLEKSRVEAQAEARQLIADAQAKEEIARILTEAEAKNLQVEALAMSNFDRAVNFILDRVVGRE
jgi:hypothetical protein